MERYDDRIAGVLSCYDRLVITGTLPVVCYAAGMTGYLNANGIRIFDYPEFAKTLRDRVRERAASHASASADRQFRCGTRSRCVACNLGCSRRRASALIILRQPNAGLDFRCGRQCFGQGGWQGGGDQYPVFSHPDRSADVAQGIFDHDLVALVAEDQADARTVFRLAFPVIKRGEIEVHLAGMLRLEGADLEIDSNQTAQPAALARLRGFAPGKTDFGPEAVR